MTTISVESGNPKYDSRNNCNAIIETSTKYLILGCKNTIIPNDVTTIGYNAFFGCTGLTTLTIPNSITTIDIAAFCGCTGLTSVTIPNSITTINYSAFSDCSSLASISIPKSVTNLYDCSFSGCIGLTSITVESDNTKYDSRDGCNAIIETSTNTLISGCKTTVIPNSVTSIGYGAFQDLSVLTSIDIPNSITTIHSFAFCGCTGLKSITFPNSVSHIEEEAFYDRYQDIELASLTSVHISDLASWCRISFGDVGANPLRYAHHLYLGDEEIKDLVIPDGVTSIHDNLFAYCYGLTSVTIPNSVTSIGNFAFEECNGLTSVTINKAQPISIFSNTFSNRTSATLYVPYGSKAAYEAADYWKEFKEFVEFETPEHSNILAADDAQGYSGHQVSLNVNLTNEDEVKLCQFDLRLPAGVTVALNEKGKLDAKLSERAETHSISGKQLSNGDYRFIISSMDNDSFTGNDGTLLNITLDVLSTVEAGVYSVKVLNVELSVPDGTDLKVVKPADTESEMTIKAYIPGDVNNDGSVSVTDVGCAINYILEQVPSVFIFDAADMNGDKAISVTDVGMIINLILSGEAASSRGIAEINEKSISPSISLRPTTEGYELLLENKDGFIGIQFDVQLADGAQLNGMQLTSDSEHLMTYRKLDNGKYRVICYSPSNSTFAADASSLLTIATNSDVDISDIRLTTTSFNELRIGNVSGETTGIADRLFVQNTEVKVYSLDGRLCRIISEKTGENPLQGLQPGIYMIGNRKVIVK